MIYYVDIDNTICNTGYGDYEAATPYYDRITKINKLFDEGHTVVYWTARGTMTGYDWRKLTEQQLQQWGCKYHELKMKKPYWDVFIDDHNINSEDFFQ